MHTGEPGGTDESLVSHICTVQQTLHGKQVPTAICHLLWHLLATRVVLLRSVREQQCAVLLLTHLRSFRTATPEILLCKAVKAFQVW